MAAGPSKGIQIDRLTTAHPAFKFFELDFHGGHPTNERHLRRAEQVDATEITNVAKHEVVEASAKGAIFIAGNEQLATASDCTAWPLQSRRCPPTCAGMIVVAFTRALLVTIL